MRLTGRIYIAAAFLFIVCVKAGADTGALIDVRDLGQNKKINPNVFGTSLIGWEIEHGKKIKSNYEVGADYGYGVWDPKWKEFNKEPLELIKGTGIKSIRFIGQFTDWEKGVSEFGRKEYQFGLDEQMEFCKVIGAEPIICLQNLYLTDSYERLISYLKKRHPDVRYIEIGNESWYILSPEEYAERYLFYYNMFKKLNPSLKLGVVGKDELWDTKVIERIGDKFDFMVKHYYPYGGKNNDIHQDSKKIFSGLLIKTLMGEVNIKETHNLIVKLIGKDKPIMVTEFNAWFAQEKPVPYRHCLGSALVNAELLKIFMRPENNILTANYWNFVNEYWGMIANGFNGKYETLNKPYYKRPNYYVFEMYHRHFGEILLEAEVQADGYAAGQYRLEKSISGRDAEIPYLSVNVSKSVDGRKVYLMVINKNMDAPVTAAIHLQNFIPAGKAQAWVLNGPAVDATNEAKPNNVRIKEKGFEIKTIPFEFTFEPHSLTAIEVGKGKDL